MGSCWSGSASASAGAGEREPLVKKTASARLFAETLFGRLEADENGDVRVRDVMRELRRDRAAAATALGLPVEVARGGNKGGADGGRQALLMRVGDALKLGGEDGAALASSIDVLFEAYSDTDLRTISLDERRAGPIIMRISVRCERSKAAYSCGGGVSHTANSRRSRVRWDATQAFWISRVGAVIHRYGAGCICEVLMPCISVCEWGRACGGGRSGCVCIIVEREWIRGACGWYMLCILFYQI